MRSEKRSTGQRTFIEQARRAQLIDAATAVLAEHGYAQASLARIAERAGISKSAVMYHFDGRDDLVEQVAEAVNAAAAEVMVPAQQRATSSAGRLEAYIRSNLGFLRDHPAAVRALTAIHAEHRPGSRPGAGGLETDGPHGKQPRQSEPSWNQSMVDAALLPLVGMLERGQSDGSFAAFDAVTMARTLRAAIDAIASSVDPSDSRIECDHEADELVVLFSRAVGITTVVAPASTAAASSAATPTPVTS